MPAWTGRHIALVAAVALLPLFLTASLMYGPGSGLPGAAVAIAPALFYAGFALTAVAGAQRRLERSYARRYSEVVRRVDEFQPCEVRLSRQYFESRLEQEIKRSRRHQLPLCVLTISTPPDRERAVHTSQLVELTSRALRAEDCAGRLGRHQFAIFLPHTSPAGAAVVVERLRQEFRDKKASFGLAYLEPGRSATARQLLHEAVAARPQSMRGDTCCGQPRFAVLVTELRSFQGG